MELLQTLFKWVAGIFALVMIVAAIVMPLVAYIILWLLSINSILAEYSQEDPTKVTIWCQLIVIITTAGMYFLHGNESSNYFALVAMFASALGFFAEIASHDKPTYRSVISQLSTLASVILLALVCMVTCE